MIKMPEKQKAKIDSIISLPNNETEFIARYYRGSFEHFLISYFIILDCSISAESLSRPETLVHLVQNEMPDSRLNECTLIPLVAEAPFS